MKIGFILSGNHHIAGARLQGFLMHQEFVRRGIDSTILHYPEGYDTDVPFESHDAGRWVEEGFTCIIFQKVFSVNAERLARRLIASGVRTIYVACNLQGHNMVATCDATIAVSSFLRRAYGRRYRTRITAIEDPIEVPAHLFKRDYGIKKTGPLAVYVAGEPPGPYLQSLAGATEIPWTLMELSAPTKEQEAEHDPTKTSVMLDQQRGIHWAEKLVRLRQSVDLADVPWKLRWAFYRWKEMNNMKGVKPSLNMVIHHIDWQLETVYARILEADIAVIPCELQYEWSLAKSGNRLLMFMALGMPVIASPLPAYRALVDEAGAPSWLIAKTHEDWRRAYSRWTDESLRKATGAQLREFALRQYSIEKVADRYLQVVEGCNRPSGGG